MSSKIFFLEGNIGSGKSTLLDKIYEKYPEDFQVLKEPLDTWLGINDSYGRNPLQCFYSDPKKYSYLLQSLAFITRFEKLEQIDFTKKYIIIERSIFSDKNVFATNCFEMGIMEEIEWNVYNHWFRKMAEKINFNFEFLYLKCQPSTSFSRLSVRSRNEENSVQIDYIEKIHLLHERWLTPENCKVIDAEVDFVNDEFSLENIISQITC